MAGIDGALREINIKDGMPRRDDAIKRITYNIKNAAPFGVAAIKIIHGYGSSGKGGVIRTEARKYLDRLKRQGQIKDYIIGEEFSIFNEQTLKAFQVCGATATLSGTITGLLLSFCDIASILTFAVRGLREERAGR